MSCDHCVRAVTEEVTAVAGVTGVDVQLDGGRLSVQSEVPVSTDAIRRAVEEAGYELIEGAEHEHDH